MKKSFNLERLVLKFNYSLNRHHLHSRSLFRLRLGYVIRFTILICILFFTKMASAQNYAPEFSSIKAMAEDSSSELVNQSGTDSVNISQMVQAQIEAARKKQLEQQSQSSLPVVLKAKENKAGEETTFAEMRKMIPLSDNLIMKFFILGSAGFLASIFIFIRRLQSKKKSVNCDLKKNIKLLREEKIFSPKDKKLSGLRTKLAGAPSTFELSNKAVARNAREMNIAKGEIYLAAKIKSHEMNKAGGRKH